jgi:nucleoside-diphosphate-sugar epimerase
LGAFGISEPPNFVSLI